MKLKDIKIGTQLIFGFATIILFVLLLGIVSHNQTKRTQLLTDSLYDHPFQVQKAIGALRSDILAIHREMKDLVLAADQNELTQSLGRLKVWEADAFAQIEILSERYLGNISDIDSVKQEFIIWNSLREETIRIIHEGNLVEAGNRTKLHGVAGSKVEGILEEIDVIDTFAQNKAIEFNTNSERLFNKLTVQLIVLVVIILLLSLIIIYVIVRNIRKPIAALTQATSQFQKGDFTARSIYQSNNEFGVLSDSFNRHADKIELNLKLNEKVADLSALMLSEDDAQKFYRSFLLKLSEDTGSQMAAIYLLNDDQKTYKHCSSIGLENSAWQSFSSENAEGVFGAAILSCQVQHIKKIPDDTRFVFNTLNGKYIPREMITIPVCEGTTPMALIFLGTVGKFNKLTLPLIEKILVTFSARLSGLLAYQKIQVFSNELEIQKEQLAKASAYNRGLIDASIDSLITIAPNGIITDANSSTEAFLGLKREELIGTDVSNYFTEPHLAKAGYQKVFQEGVVRDYELVMRNKNGKEIPVIYNASVYRDENGEVIGILAAARDITERKMAEQELKRLNDELTKRSEKLSLANSELEAQKTELSSQSSELRMQNTELEMQKNQLDEANRLKTIFLLNMSHELRTPLNSVIALSGVLSRRLTNKIPDEEHSYLEVIERNGKHLLDLINDILDISRIEAGKEEVEISTFNLNTCITEVVSMIEPQARTKNIELHFSSDDDSITIASDAGKIRHIMQNLIGNAVKFTEQGKVEVKTQLLAGKIVITVADTGIGISEENQQHIFDEFRQADSSTSRKFGGSGLGLAIAKKYANFLGGTITVKSLPEEGSEFTVLLPAVYHPENEVKYKPSASISLNKKSSYSVPEQFYFTKNILLVEDSEPAIIQIRDILEEEKYNIVVARDGQQALDTLSYTLPDAIILDLMMPGVDGFEVLERVRNAEVTANIPVLILTAKHITKEELKFLKRNNVHQLIQKGNVNRDELLNAVKSMLYTAPVETEKALKVWPTIVGKPRVLVVEDNLDNMLTAKAILSDNYEVIEATDGLQGVEMAKKHLPDLILMDIHLPEMDGIEAFQMIRNNARLQHIPVIALTASAMTSERETILAYGFDAYIAKPIDELFFFKTIKEVLYGE